MVATSTLTKTKAKKSLLVTFSQEEDKSILKQIKKNCENVILTKSKANNPSDTNDDDETSERDSATKKNCCYLLEFSNPKAAKEAKAVLEKNIDTSLAQIEYPFTKMKKESIVARKQENKENNKNSDGKSSSQNGGPKPFEIKLPKLILRNLSFKMTEETLRKEMEKYGKVVLTNLPLKEDGKLKGFGFVQFQTLAEAKKALDDLNSDGGKKLAGNRVIVDWCVPKNIFQRLESQASKSKEADDESEDKKSNGKEEGSDDEDEDEEGEEEKDDDEDEDSENEEEEDEDEEEEDEDEDDESGKRKRRKVDEGGGKKPGDESKRFEKKAKTGTQDVMEKRTVFVRNLSFDTSEEGIEHAFSRFGPIKYVKICMDRELDRPRGTAFVQFETSEAAERACAESNEFELDFRKLQVDMAVSRNQVTELVEHKKTEKSAPKDKRNLALAKEGVVYPNSYEAEGVSKAEMAQRAKIEASNAQKLKLLHYFVSPTRLSVHNIPIKCSDQELRAIFERAVAAGGDHFKSASNRWSPIKECRIMRDLTRVNSEGVAKSKGYGFVEFKTHDMALKALRATNNNPDVFGVSSSGDSRSNKQKTTATRSRLIVQFSIEDMRALKKKQERAEKMHRKTPTRANSFPKKNNTKTKFAKNTRNSSKNTNKNIKTTNKRKR